MYLNLAIESYQRIVLTFKSLKAIYIFCFMFTHLITNTTFSSKAFFHFSFSQLFLVMAGLHLLIEFFVHMRNQSDFVLQNPQFRVVCRKRIHFLVKMTSLQILTMDIGGNHISKTNIS